MTALRRRLARRDHDDRGAATIFFVVLSVMLFVVAGLVVDGGLAINARGRAADDAEQAARAGAQHIDLEALRGPGGIVRLNPGEASAAAQAFLAARGYNSGTATVVAAGDQVAVTVRAQEDTALLGLIGIHTFDVEASAQARPAVGIADEIP